MSTPQISILQIDSLQFTFAPTVVAEHYDSWQHYSAVWNITGGQKSMDIVAIESTTILETTWLIEAKDFRIITQPPRPTNLSGLAQTVASKARDTLAGLADAATHAAVPTEKNHATSAVTATNRRVVLHLEPHTGSHSALFPLGFSAVIHQQLKQLVNNIDPNPLVLNIANTPTANVPWSVS